MLRGLGRSAVARYYQSASCEAQKLRAGPGLAVVSGRVVSWAFDVESLAVCPPASGARGTQVSVCAHTHCVSVTRLFAEASLPTGETRGTVWWIIAGAALGKEGSAGCLRPPLPCGLLGLAGCSFTRGGCGVQSVAGVCGRGDCGAELVSSGVALRLCGAARLTSTQSRLIGCCF